MLSAEGDARFPFNWLLIGRVLRDVNGGHFLSSLASFRNNRSVAELAFFRDLACNLVFARDYNFIFCLYDLLVVSILEIEFVLPEREPQSSDCE